MIIPEPTRHARWPKGGRDEQGEGGQGREQASEMATGGEEELFRRCTVLG